MKRYYNYRAIQMTKKPKCMSTQHPDMNITLIGMSNSGKSTVGKELAKRLNYKFIDTDKIIEEMLSLKLQQIVNDFGEDEFLEIEEQTVLKLGKLDNCVISPGGSIVYSIDAMRFLKKNSVVVFLNASFESINKRISDQPMRGIIGLKKKGLKALFDERLPIYEKYADITIEMPADFNIDAVIKNIIQNMRWLRE